MPYGAQWFSLFGLLIQILQLCALCQLCAHSGFSWPWFLLAYQWVISTLRLTSCDSWLWIQWITCCTRANPMEQNSFSGLGVSLVCPLCLSFVELFGWYSHVIWSPALCMLVLEPLRSGSVQVKFSRHLCQAWGCLVGATKWSSIGFNLYWAWRSLQRLCYKPKLAATSTGLGTIWYEVSNHLCWSCGSSVELTF